MKEIILKENNYKEIMEYAKNDFVENNSFGNKTFLTKCIINSFLFYLNKNELKVINGKILKNEKTE